MAAYVSVHLWEERDRAWREEYAPKVSVLVQKYGGRYLVRTDKPVERLEGERALPIGMGVLEFPSVEQTKAWHQDPKYAPLIQLRQANATFDLVVVDGI